MSTSSATALVDGVLQVNLVTNTTYSTQPAQTAHHLQKRKEILHPFTRSLRLISSHVRNILIDQFNIARKPRPIRLPRLRRRPKPVPIGLHVDVQPIPMIAGTLADGVQCIPEPLDLGGGGFAAVESLFECGEAG